MIKAKNLFTSIILFSGLLVIALGLIRAQEQSQKENESKYWTVAGYRLRTVLPAGKLLY